MKKILAWTSLLMGVFMVFGVAACGNGETPASGGTTENEETETVGGGGHEHVAETFGSDEDMHWKVCADCGETFIEEDHKYSGSNVCTECGYTIPETVGLEYELDPETDTYSVEGIGTAGDVETLYIPAYHNGKKVTEIGYGAFYACESNFSAVKIPSTVERIEGGAFGECNALTELKVPDSVTYFKGVGGNAHLKSVTFGKNSKLETVGKATFGYCPELTYVNLPDSVRLIEDDTFEESKIYTDKSFRTDGILYVGNHVIDADETVSGKVTIREGTKTIAQAAFLHSGEVTEVVLPESLVALHGYARRGAKSVTIPKGVEIIGLNTFSSVYVEHSMEHISVESGNAFYNDGNGANCIIETATSTLIVGSSNTQLTAAMGIKEFGHGVFQGCDFESFTIPDGVTDLGGSTFAKCAKLKSVEIPASVTELGFDTFWECSELRNIVYRGSMDEWKALEERSQGWIGGSSISSRITVTITCNNGTLTKEVIM